MLNYESGSVKNIHYGDIHTKFSTLFDISTETVPFINPSVPLDKVKPDSYCVEGDIIFADASEDLDDVGKSIEIVNLHNENLLSGLHTLLARQKEENLIIGFGGYLFKSAKVRAQIKKESQGAKVFGISAGRISGIQINFPSDKQEQQKIAACLSSLDDLIAAQTQKLDALKAHKKGLMQQLFPAEGETVPKLRFAEFRDKGEWEGKKLGDIAAIRAGTTPSRSQSEFYANGSIHWVKTTDLNNSYIYTTEEKVSSVAKVKLNLEGSVLVAMYGGFNQIGRTGYLKITAATNQAISVLSVKKDKLTSLYLLTWLNAKIGYWRKLAVSSRKDANITGADVAAFPIMLPGLPEQQKIAACLSSLDDLITAQAQKIETLKKHKKGLMQQLFPR